MCRTRRIRREQAASKLNNLKRRSDSSNNLEEQNRSNGNSHTSVVILMSPLKLKLFCVVSLTLCCLSASFFSRTGQAQKDTASRGAQTITVPRTWDEKELAELELPLAVRNVSPVLVPPDYYYRIPVRPIFKTYPVYVPGKEPKGYIEWLKQQEPEIVFDPSRLRTEEDWIRAGKTVFHSPIAYDVIITQDDLKKPEWYKKVSAPVAKDGTMHFIRYGIREKGKVEVGILSCATCHTRLMPDGTLLDGGQGNFPYNRAIAWSYQARQTEDFVRGDIKLMYGTPWLNPDPHAALTSGTMAEMLAREESLPPGVVARNGTSPLYPTAVPNIIGVKDRRYLDATGLIRHRSIGDLMRYIALAQGIDFVSRYGSFIPRAEGNPPVLPDPTTLEAKRYSDEQLYALALYVYSLQQPPNPNKFDALASRGEKIFKSENCSGCHTPPLYTNNALTPVDGFRVPPEDQEKFRILPLSVGTDPDLALKTRRGTGYYKVPSLLGLWYRESFGHSGEVTTLEEWFDPRRTKENFVPSGFKGYGVKARAVKGHVYGLNLSKEDRKALIAFLKTL